MVHNGSEQCRRGGQHSGWALGQSGKARGTFLVLTTLRWVPVSLFMCGLPVTTHFVVTPAKSHLPTPATRNYRKSPKKASFSFARPELYPPASGDSSV